MFWRDLGLFCGCWAVVFGGLGTWALCWDGSLWYPAGTDLWNIAGPAIRFGLLGDLRIMNARAAWMFHGRAYAGGRFVFLFRSASLGTP